jgi:predicted GH43/DUF377 family glycosyl hydrolase
MFSANVHFRNDRRLLLKPAFPWELGHIGNCGSPIETSTGWLVLTHGVGPTRTYSIGAFLHARNDPGRVIGRLYEPLTPVVRPITPPISRPPHSLRCWRP